MGLMEKHLPILKGDGFMDLWIKPVFNILNRVQSENITVYQKIVTRGFQIKPAIFKKL